MEGKHLWGSPGEDPACLPRHPNWVPGRLLGALQDAASSLISRARRYIFYCHLTTRWIRCQSQVSWLSPWVTCIKIAPTSITGALCHLCRIGFPCTDCAGTDAKILWSYRCEPLATIIPVLVQTGTYNFNVKICKQRSIKDLVRIERWRNSAHNPLKLLTSWCCANFHNCYISLKQKGAPGFLIFVQVLTLLLQTLLVSWHLVGEHLQRSRWSTCFR